MRIFRTSATCRASEGGKSEFLRVRRARDLDTLPQKERKPRLKKTILRRNRAFSNGGVVAQKAKNREAEKAQSFFTLILEIFRLIQARQNRILQASPLKCAVRIFRMSEVKRANEDGKSEFLRVRRARDLDILPQKERKPRLKKTILRRNRVPPQRAIVRLVRRVVFEWRGCRSKSEKRKGPNSNKLSEPFPFCFSLIKRYI